MLQNEIIVIADEYSHMIPPYSYTFPYYNSNNFFLQGSYMKRHENVKFGMQFTIFMPKKRIKCRFVYDILKNGTEVL